jgi:hypothetical protein
MKHIKLFEQFLNEVVSVDTVRYKRSHGKEPRGTGNWAFYFDRIGGDPMFTPTAMSYVDAVKWAKEEAKKAGKSIVYVGESINEAKQPKLNINILSNLWADEFGESLEDDYYDVWKRLKKAGSFTLDKLEDIWNAQYGDMFRSQFNIIYQKLKESLTEATSDTVLYKVHFKPEYSLDDDSTNTPIKPVFVQMNTAERTNIANYAAVEKIGGYGKTTTDRLLAKDRIDTKEMSFAELFKMIKSLHRIKIQR